MSKVDPFAPLRETAEAFRVGELRALEALNRERMLPVTGDRLLASLACHIDHDEPPGMAARGLAKSALELLGGLSSFQVVMLSGHLRELAQKFKPGEPGEGTST
jgi:hypothetical protein